MKINAQFDQRVLVHSEAMEWVDSPMPGVSRRPLDRVGDEVARATSIVRYAPGSHFSPHVHTGGEEFVVLDGVFQDEHGDFPVGSYIRNPPQSSHTPGSENGCVIFVKLWQFQPDDRTHVRIDDVTALSEVPRDQGGVQKMILYQDDFEQVSIQSWLAGHEIDLVFKQGAEVLVLEGSFDEGADNLVKNSWLRMPCGYSFKASVGAQGAKVWLKQNHLGRVAQEIARLPVAG